MYFKVSMRTNPATGIYSGYYRLVESYRNHCDRVCHRTILNAGYLDGLTTGQLHMIQKILTLKVSNHDNLLFELPYTDDPTVIHYVDEFYNRMVTEKRIDVFVEKKDRKTSKGGKDLQVIDVNSIRNKDVREVGAEWMSYQAIRQLQFAPFLESLGWDQEEVYLALTHIISRAVYPASELETTRWIRENSAVCEITGYDIEKITKDRLYTISRKLWSEKESLEHHLSVRTNELFDIQDKIVLYDLTNTYFEGRKQGSKVAKFGRSKEKRNDARLIVLGLVINHEEVIMIRRCSEPNQNVCKLYDALKFKYAPFAKRKSVVHKSELENCQFTEKQQFRSD